MTKVGQSRFKVVKESSESRLFYLSAQYPTASQIRPFIRKNKNPQTPTFFSHFKIAAFFSEVFVVILYNLRLLRMRFRLKQI